MCPKIQAALLGVILLLCAVAAQSSPMISEFSADSSTSIVDDDGEFSDWLEVANLSDAPLLLSGYYLTDDPELLTKWQFPNQSGIDAGGYLLVFASGKNRTVAGSPLHTNFQLAAGGEFLALVEPDGVTVVHAFAPAYPPQFDGATYGIGIASEADPVTFLTEGANARWFVPGGPEPVVEDWTSLDYVDDDWASGKTGIGYQYDELVGDGSETREAMQGVNASIYVRIPFEISSPAAVVALTLRMKYEDGFVAFLNGEPVAAANALPEELQWNSTSTTSHPDSEAVVFEDYTIDFAGKLVAGTNMLAFQGLNSSRGGSDFLLLPELTGESVDLTLSASAGFFEQPTPGQPNTPLTYTGVVSNVEFSVARGFFDAPFQVEISSGTVGASVYYTTDGSVPSEVNGTTYTDPIEITTTTTLRAAAFVSGMRPSNTGTQSYLFLADVIRQPALPEGAPNRWGSRTPDYAMDPDVVDDPAYRDIMVEALKSIRTLSIVVDPDDFWNQPRGIYANPQNDGRAWERSISMEFIDPTGGDSVQANAGIRIHGNGSRSANGQPKHGFRIEFRGEYGDPTLNYPLFPDSPVTEFDSLILRGQNAHGWTRSSQIANAAGTEREQSQYIRDSFARDLMKEMGHTSGEATYVHLYINGLYWGLYNPVEYPRSFYGKSHFGGIEEDYDVINRRTTTTKLLDGTWDAWREMQGLANSGLETPEKYAEIEEHIDVDNLIDYMLMHQYMGSRDGPEVFNSNNMRAIRKTRGDNPTRWIGMPWDMEASMFEIDVTRNVNVDDPNTLVRIYTRLRENPEFRLRYADRVHRHCFNGGPLSPEGAAAIWEARADEIYLAIIGESARWGDYRRPSRPFTRDVEWQAERERLLTTYFPTRTEFLIDLLQRNDLYPEVDAPIFDVNGSIVEPGFELTMSAAEGAIYFTTDGTDPRLQGGEISESASVISGGINEVVLVPRNAQWRYLDDGSDQKVAWREREFDDSSWRTGAAELGYGDRDEETVIEFGNALDKHVTYYFRKEFTLDAGMVTALDLELVRDDGAVVYLNGEEVYRDNLPAGEISYETTALDSKSGDEESTFQLVEIDPEMLVVGSNVLAVEVHQDSPTGSDVSFNASLTARQASSDQSPALVINGATTIRARTLSDGVWSAVNEASLSLPPIAADASNLVISEILYDSKGSDLEFIELLNISATHTLDLRGVKIVEGIAYTFENTTLLQPGDRLIIDEREFADGTALSNGGEPIRVNDASGATIQGFTYDQNPPWPAGADGLGFSIVLVSPEKNPDPNDPVNWKRGNHVGGTPGSADIERAFQGDPLADNDGDGLNALLEFALGNSDEDPTDGFPLSFSMGEGLNLRLRFPVDPAATGLNLRVETSVDLSLWSTNPDLILDEIEVIDGRHFESWNIPSSEGEPLFVRVRVEAK